MNKLKEENSPYLIQHAHNPVDWYPWSKEAQDKAIAEDKPIFLSIGYAACHWCHVMAHESFEDPDIANVMNEHFINIKVDREERPDIDNIYMSAVIAMTGQGGWPLNVFLSPSGKPFYGGTYFPPHPRYNMPSFKEVLLSVARVWKEDRQKILDSSTKITEYLQNTKTLYSNAVKIEKTYLERASLGLAQAYDWDHGGWGRAPKFPQPMALEYLLRQASLGDKFSLEMCTHALDAMAKGGMYDVVGGGFSRYSTDDNWEIPHFEKMLYDNAQLSQVYLYAYLLTGEDRYRIVCERTLNFVVRELRDPQGGFYSSLDADSEGEEGKFYTWTLEEITQALGEESGVALIKLAYGITPGGNFEGKNVLQQRIDNQTLADRLDINVDELDERINYLQKILLEARSQRTRPGIDDKVITSWNALMLISFAEAARYLDRKDYLNIATNNAEFLLKNMYQNGLLLRSWRKGKSGHVAYLEDYASLVLGLLSIYQSEPDPHWFNNANNLLNEMRDHFNHPQGGYFDTRDDHEHLILRPRDLQDNAVPSGNALAVLALLQMSAYTGRGDLRDEAERMLSFMQSDAVRYPLGFSKWLTALDFAINPIKEVAVLGDPNNQDTIALKEVVWSKYRSHLIFAQDRFPPDEASPRLLFDRPLKHEKSTAYVCQNFTCQVPVNSPDELRSQLEESQN